MARPWQGWLRHRATVWACRLAMGAVFGVAALGKLKDPVKFMGSLSEYHLLPAAVLPLGAAGMPGVELLVALSLITGLRLRSGALVATGLMVVFIGAIASAMARGLDLDCSCFDLLGVSSRVGWGVLGRDALLLLLCLPLLMKKEPDPS